MFRKRENIGNQSDVMFMGEWGTFKQTVFYELLVINAFSNPLNV